MRCKFTRYVLPVFPLVLAMAASGQTNYYPYNQLSQPTPADLMAYSGRAKTIVVQMLNLTPYNIRYVPTPQVRAGVANLNQQISVNRNAQKSFIFAPVGVPNLIPGVSAQAFPDLPGYNPAYINTDSHPRSAVFAWDDQKDFVDKSSVFWTVEGVRYYTCNGCPTQRADVPLGLFMSRVKPEGSLRTGFLPVLVDIVKIGATMVKITIDPVNPLNWIKAFLGMKELADDALFAQQQKAADEAGKMYVSAYTIPEVSTPCYLDNSKTGCMPSALYNDDATEAQWGTATGGYATAALVVTTHVLRGQPAEQSWIENIDGRRGKLGSLSFVMVTIMRSEDYIAAYAAKVAQMPRVAAAPGRIEVSADVRANFDQLRKLLAKHDLRGLDALRFVIGVLDPWQRQDLRGVIQSVLAGEPVTNAQRQALHKLIVDMRHALNEKEEG
ncbi:MAG TPA: hypothetical protein VGM23_04075 [Armatimonadota bacterium]